MNCFCCSSKKVFTLFIISVLLLFLNCSRIYFNLTTSSFAAISLLLSISRRAGAEVALLQGHCQRCGLADEGAHAGRYPEMGGPLNQRHRQSA